jgi:hypothetical protein
MSLNSQSRFEKGRRRSLAWAEQITPLPLCLSTRDCEDSHARGNDEHGNRPRDGKHLFALDG